MNRLHSSGLLLAAAIGIVASVYFEGWVTRSLSPGAAPSPAAAARR